MMAVTIWVRTGLAAQKFESLSGSPNCFIAHPWDWGLFYGPGVALLLVLTLLRVWLTLQARSVAFNWLVGSPLMLAVIIKVWRVRKRLQEEKGTGVSIEHFVRLVLLVLVFWLISLFFVCHRIYSEVVSVRTVLNSLTEGLSISVSDERLQDDIEQAVADQIACSAASGEACPLTKRFNDGSWYGVLYCSHHWYHTHAHSHARTRAHAGSSKRWLSADRESSLLRSWELPRCVVWQQNLPVVTLSQPSGGLICLCGCVQELFKFWPRLFKRWLTDCTSAAEQVRPEEEEEDTDGGL
jgi:hypothetical protein